jgi:hypothetical protein
MRIGGLSPGRLGCRNGVSGGKKKISENHSLRLGEISLFGWKKPSCLVWERVFPKVKQLDFTKRPNFGRWLQRVDAGKSQIGYWSNVP